MVCAVNSQFRAGRAWTGPADQHPWLVQFVGGPDGPPRPDDFTIVRAPSPDQAAVKFLNARRDELPTERLIWLYVGDKCEGTWNGVPARGKYFGVAYDPSKEGGSIRDGKG